MRRGVALLILVLCAGQDVLAQTGPAGPAPAPVEVGQPDSLEPIRRAQRSAKLGVAMTMVVPVLASLHTPGSAHQRGEQPELLRSQVTLTNH